MSSAAGESSGKKRRNILVLLPLIAFLALAALVSDPARRRRSRRAAVRADRPPGAARPICRRSPGSTRDGKAGAGPEQRGVPRRGDAGERLGVLVRALPDEVPFLEKLSADKRIQLVGINYKDQTDNARRFLDRYGNPFVAVGADASGRAVDRLGRLWRAGDLI